MRQNETISTLENRIFEIKNQIAETRKQMPKPTLSMKPKREAEIERAWATIETLNDKLVELENALKTSKQNESYATKSQRRIGVDKELRNLNSETPRLSGRTLAVWQTSTGKYQAQASNSYKRYSVIDDNGKLVCNCMKEDCEHVHAVAERLSSGEFKPSQVKVKPPTILPGRKFYAPSKKKPAVWVVTERIKNEEENIIRCRVIEGEPQEREYLGQQFGYLIRQGIIRLANETVQATA